MMTTRLFYENVYQQEFEAKVLFCGQEGEKNYLLLDKTCFYPEGGGQPADRGKLLWAGDTKEQGKSGCLRVEETENLQIINVVDVQYVDGEIRHYVDKPVASDAMIRGKIDWQRRFDLMQQHSGEHIVSGMIHEKYGYDNVGFHMGEDLITIDLNGIITREELEEIEERVNTYLWKNQKIHIFYPKEDDREKAEYRSKREIEGELRLVEFPGADCCACCGLHVERTGEIGLVKLLSVKHFREGVRIEMVSGKRALTLLNSHLQANSAIAVELSARAGETAAAVNRLQEENYRLKGQMIKMNNEHFARRAEQSEGKGDVVFFEPIMEATEVRKETDKILDNCGGVCVVLSGEDGQGYKYAIGCREGDIRPVLKEMNKTLCGRGGGKPDFAQGSLQAEKKQIEAFFQERNFTIL